MFEVSILQTEENTGRLITDIGKFKLVCCTDNKRFILADDQGAWYQVFGDVRNKEAELVGYMVQ